MSFWTHTHQRINDRRSNRNDATRQKMVFLSAKKKEFSGTQEPHRYARDTAIKMLTECAIQRRNNAQKHTHTPEYVHIVVEVFCLDSFRLAFRRFRQKNSVWRNFTARFCSSCFFLSLVFLLPNKFSSRSFVVIVAFDERNQAHKTRQSKWNSKHKNFTFEWYRRRRTHTHTIVYW